METQEDNLMEDTIEAEENDNLLTQNKVDNVDETAENLMTEMSLDDEPDYFREKLPGEDWLYHIEVFPWNVMDMTDSLMKIIKLASFSEIVLKKKLATKPSDHQETLEDNVQERQRKGCLHLYIDSSHTAKTIMRIITWKTMIEKELNFEITRQCPLFRNRETASFTADTYLLSKSRFRDKIKGEDRDRTANISNLPGNISRELLDVVFTRAQVNYIDTASNASGDKNKNLQLKLQDSEGFNGSLELDCCNKTNCRSLVLAYKKIFIGGQKVSLQPKNTQIMEVQPSTEAVGGKDKPNNTSKVPSSGKKVKPLLAAPLTRRGQPHGIGMARGPGNPSFGPSRPSLTFGRGHQREMTTGAFRARGMGRSSTASPRPVSASFPRGGPGMPTPMTGRQKMNEKLKRMVSGSSLGTPFLMAGSNAPGRNVGMGTVGDSFKHEIASLQSQLERNTQAIEAQIARLKQESNFFNEDMGSYDEGRWSVNDFAYEEEEPNYMYSDFGDLRHDELGPVQNQMHQFPRGFAHQVLQGSARKKKGMMRGAAAHQAVPVMSNRRTRNQQRGRGALLRRGGRGQKSELPPTKMAWAGHQDDFW